jgi:hypothetical protein
MLKNGTSIEHGPALDFEKGYLTPAKETGLITEGEIVRRRLATYMWVVLKDGPEKGKRACVSALMRRGKDAPL